LTVTYNRVYTLPAQKINFVRQPLVQNTRKKWSKPYQ